VTEKRKSLKERIEDVGEGVPEQPPTFTSDDKLLSETRPVVVQSNSFDLKSLVPWVIGILLLAGLAYVFTRPASMTGAVVGVNDNQTIELRDELTSKQTLLNDCTTRLMNCTAAVSYRNCPDNSGELASLRLQLTSTQSNWNDCSAALTTCNSNIQNCSDYSALNSSYNTVLASLSNLSLNYFNLSSNWTVLNSSYWNCSRDLNASNATYFGWQSNWLSCNSSYYAANTTILGLNSNITFLGSQISSLSSLNSYLMANVTCLSCWKEQNYTRYFWNETSRELFCTNITWMTYAVDQGAC
jgi:hypothetical protein